MLVENPEHNPEGDFSLNNGVLNAQSDCGAKHTFSGIALYHKSFFDEQPADFLPLAPLLREKMSDQLVTGELYLGQWFDIGTPERLAEINQWSIAD